MRCWYVEVRVQRANGRRRWMRSKALTLTEARRAHDEYRGLGHQSRIVGGDPRPPLSSGRGHLGPGELAA